MLDDGGVERPSGIGFRDQILDLALDLTLVGLIVEMGDAFLALGVIPHGPEEEGRGAAGRVGDLLEKRRSVDRGA